MPARHVPVLLPRTVELLAPALESPDAVLVDATLGLGGHALALLEACPHARLIGIDTDPQALAAAAERLAPHAGRVDLVHARYDRIGEILTECAGGRAQAVLFDLGVSSLQLDLVERGFSYARDAPLDMRMDPTRGPSAADVLADYPAGALASVLRRWGQEPFATRIAERIVRERAREPITRSARLVQIVREAVPAAARRTGGHPAKRTFQALRIEVNGELDCLNAALEAAVDHLEVGGRIVAMSYQGLEDRLVKRALASRSTSQAPPDLPVEPEELKPRLRLLTRGAERPSEAELEANPRSAPARLRAAERIRPDPRRPT